MVRPKASPQRRAVPTIRLKIKKLQKRKGGKEPKNRGSPPDGTGARGVEPLEISEAGARLRRRHSSFPEAKRRARSPIGPGRTQEGLSVDVLIEAKGEVARSIPQQEEEEEARRGFALCCTQHEEEEVRVGDSLKESGSSLGTRREIARKKIGGLAARLLEVAGVCG
ncbi:hypothetical protein B296_00041002, partial [Ensete ventricosum]